MEQNEQLNQTLDQPNEIYGTNENQIIENPSSIIQSLQQSQVQVPADDQAVKSEFLKSEKFQWIQKIEAEMQIDAEQKEIINDEFYIELYTDYEPEMEETNEGGILTLETRLKDADEMQYLTQQTNQILIEDENRIVITKIIIENFKSFSGRVVICPISETFNAIVGANGSGKSNLMESLLFLFGKRAKQMRLKHLSELIHNSQYQSYNSASVEAYFKQIKKKDESESPQQFRIKRTVYLSNLTKYEINGNENSEAEVKQFLKQYGIKPQNSRFLILQGEVEHISLIKPKKSGPHDSGLLEYLEDLIGSDQNVQKIEVLTQQNEDIIKQKRFYAERLKIIKNEDFEKMEAPKNTSIKFIKQEILLFQYQNVFYQLKKYKCEKKCMEIRDKIELKQQERISYKKKKQGIEAQIKNYEILIQGSFDQMRQKTSDIEILNSEFNDLEIQYAKFSQDYDYYVQFQQQQEQMIEKIKLWITNAIELIQQAQENLPSKIQLCQSKQKELDKMQQNIRQINEKNRQKNSQLNQEKEKLKYLITEFSNELKEKKREFIRLSERMQRLYQIADCSVELKNIQLLINQLEETISDKTIMKNSYIQQKSKLENNLTQQQNLLTIRNKQEKKLNDEINNIKTQYNRIKDAFNNKKSSSKLLSKLIKAQKRGILRGIIGRLGDLGIIHEKYDVAASTAAGNKLDCICIETQQQAQECIQHLRIHQMGQTNFIVLELIKSFMQDMNKNQDCPAGVKSLYELIATENEQNKLFFQFIYRDIYVVDNFVQAYQLAQQYSKQNKQYRIVTLKGQIIDSSGIFGGGGKSLSGLLGQISEDQYFVQDNNYLISLDKIQNARRQKEQDLNNFQLEQQNIKLQLKQLNNEKQEIEKKLNQITQELDNEIIKQSEYKYQQESMQQQQKQMQSNEQNQKQLNEQQQQCEIKILEIQQKLDNVKQQKNLVDNKIIESIEEKNYSEMVNDEQILNIECQALEKDVSKMRVQIQRAKAYTNKRNDQVVEHQNKIQKIKNVLNIITNNKDKVEEKAQKIQADIEQLNGNKQDIEKKITEERNEMNSFDSEIKQVEIKLGETNKKFDSLRKNFEIIKSQGIQLEKDLRNTRDLNNQNVTEYKQKGFYDQLDQIEQMKLVDLNAKSISAPIFKELRRRNRQIRKEERNKQLAESKIKQQAPQMISSDSISEEDEVQIIQASQSLFYINPSTSKTMVNITSINVNEDLTNEQLELGVKILKEIKAAVPQQLEKYSAFHRNLDIISEFQNKFEEYKTKLFHLLWLKEQQDHILEELNQENNLRLIIFMKGFHEINTHLKVAYQFLTKGGDAELELIDSLDPFKDGVLLSVRPPNKAWKNITKLSGGEKTISSLALIFALHKYSPNPLYIMDEVDAALDYKNVATVAKYIKEQAKNSQFLVISLREDMFNQAQELIGIYKTFDMTKTLCYIPSYEEMENLQNTSKKQISFVKNEQQC